MKRTVLFVDDNDDLRRSMARILEYEGFIALEADCGETAIHMLAAVPDVVLLDLMLTDIPGEAVLRHIREKAIPTRVVVLTGIIPGEPRIDRLADPGLRPDAVLHKPVAWPALVAACRATTRADAKGEGTGR